MRAGGFDFVCTGCDIEYEGQALSQGTKGCS